MSESLDVSLSKLAWAPSGHHIACGDIDGRVYIYEAGEVRGGAKGRPGSHVVVWMRVHLCVVVPVVMATLFLPSPSQGLYSPHVDEWQKVQQTLLDLQEELELTAQPKPLQS